MAQHTDITNLTNAQNFGEWIDKINDVIEHHNTLSKMTFDIDKVVDIALENGQLGETLVNRTTNLDYNLYTNNGVYSLPNNANNKPTNYATNLYVGSNGSAITQVAVTLETEPKIYVRAKVDDSSTFTYWYYIPSKSITDNTYLKLTGGTLTGPVTFKKTAKFNDIVVNDKALFKNDIGINHDGIELLISNNGQNTIFNSSEANNSILYYIQPEQPNGDIPITTDITGTNIKYYRYKNNIITYDTAYYLHKNGDVLTNDVIGNNIEYYIQGDGRVTLQKSGENTIYYIDDTNVYRQVVDFNRGLKENVYYVLKNNDTNSLHLNDVYSYNIEFYVNDNILYKDYKTVGYLQKNEVTGLYNKVTSDKEGNHPLYYVKDNVYYTDFALTEAVLYVVGTKVCQSPNGDNALYSIMNEELKTPNILHYIEDDVIVTYEPIGYYQYDPAFLLAAPIFISSDVDGKDILYYIRRNDTSSGVIYEYATDEDFENIVYYEIDNKVSTDIEGYNVVYYKLNNALTERVITYYLDGNKITEDAEHTNILYYRNTDDFVDTFIELLDVKYYRHKLLDTITSDKHGNVIRFYRQLDNSLSTQVDGTDVKYYLQPTTVTTDRGGQNIEFYVRGNEFVTHNVKYYIQPDKRITRDKEGIEDVYKLHENQIVLDTYPITIEMYNNVCDINGTSEKAYFLEKTGLTNSFQTPEYDKAASGLAIKNFYDYSENRYMPYEGGIFTGLVVHRNDIHLGKNRENNQTKILSDGDLTFQCLKTVAFIGNNDWAELYIDRKNEPLDKNVPCIFGARTRTEVTATEEGNLVYALGSIEFSENQTTIRLRKTNLTGVEDSNNKIDVALSLERNDNGTTFRPSEDRVVSLGSGSMRFNQLYAANGTISTSDRNLKDEIQSIDDNLLNAWKNVEWKTFKYKDAIDQKGERARVHSGLIAQELETALIGVPLSQYGFYCVDSWDDIYDTQYITTPAKYDDSGVMLEAEKKRKFKTLKKKSGYQISLRYQEIQAIENAYLRRELESLKQELAELKTLIK